MSDRYERKLETSYMPLIMPASFLNLFMTSGGLQFYFLLKISTARNHLRPAARIFALIMVPIASLYDQNSRAGPLGRFSSWSRRDVEMLDVFWEGDSRASVGGLTTGEYSLHVAATILKVASFAFIFGTKPVASWSVESPISLGSYGYMGEMMAIQVMVGSLFIGLLHFALLNKRIGSISLSYACSRLGCTGLGCCTAERQM